MRENSRVPSLNRRKALRWLAAAGAGAALTACGGAQQVSEPPASEPRVSEPLVSEPQPLEPSQPPQDSGNEDEGTPTIRAETTVPKGDIYLAAARGEDPAVITERALAAIGGIERFVKQDYDVIIKPNICTDNYSFEYGATTNPVVVATLVRLALGAGARRVRVMDFPFGGTAQSAYAKSGIQEAVKAAGGEMEIMNPNKFKNTEIPGGKAIKEWQVYQDALKADLLIDVPIAKHHGLAKATLAGKNLMGLIQNRSGIHAQMGERITDLTSLFRPGLTVVDAVRTLMRNGPTGGNLDDVKLNNLVIASHDLVAADAFAAGLFGLEGKDIAYIKASAERGLGIMDLDSVKIEEISA